MAKVNYKTVGLCVLALMISYNISALRLEEAIQHAVTTNPKVLQTIRLCLGQSQALQGAYGNYLPKLDLSAGYGIEESLNSGTMTPTNRDKTRTLMRRELSLEAKQMLFDGFATPNDVDRNKYKAEATRWLVDAEVNDMVLEVSETYINILRNRALVNWAKENVRVLQQTASMIDNRSKSGVSNPVDSVQAQGRVEQAKSNLRTAESYLNNSEINFYQTVGLNANNLSTPSVNRADLPTSEKALVQTALKNHPRLQSANADILEAKAQHNLAHSATLPTIELAAGIDKRYHIDGVYGPNNDQYAVIRTRWNLLRGGSDFAHIKETAYYTQQAAEIRNRVYRQIIENSRLNWSSYKTNEKIMINYKKHMDSARITAETYGKQFQLGQRTLLDLLNAEAEYFTAKKTYLSARYDYMIMHYRLLNSTGALLKCIDLSSISKSTDLSKIMQNPALEDFRPVSYNYDVSSNNTKNFHKKYRSTKKIQSTTTSYKHGETDSYTIQLLATSSENELKQFVEENNLAGKVSYKQNSSNNMFILTMGKFSSKAQAFKAIEELPTNLKQHIPWPKKI